MPFEKNHSLSNGRPKGSKNKNVSQIREMITDLIGDPEKLKKDLDSLDPSESVKLRISLLKYVAPTLKSIEVEASETKNVNIEPIDWV
jgi:hypothetical protein